MSINMNFRLHLAEKYDKINNVVKIAKLCKETVSLKFLKKITDKKLTVNLVGWALAAVCTVSAAIYISTVCSRGLSLMLVLNGEEVVCVDSRSTVESALLMLDDKLDASGIVYSEERDITYKYVLDNGKKADAEECMNILYDMSADDYVRAYMISVGGKDIAACPTYAEAERVVCEFRDYIVEYVKDSTEKDDSVELTTEFEIRNVICDGARVSSASDICCSLLGTDASKPLPDPDGIEGTRVTADGSSFLVAPNRYLSFGLVKNEEASNSFNNSFSFNINGVQSAIEYKTVVSEKYSEIIPFVVVEIESDELYIGETKIVSAGVNGITDNVYDVSYADGVEISRELVSSHIIAEPVDQVMLVGTKELPEAAPTGSFIWPLQQKFVITSKWGIDRSDEGLGSYHKGLDIAGVKVGDPIYAADGGTVVCAKEVGTYGLLVRIRHEDGVETYYSHMSRMDVKKGDKVYKGQKIGEIGMTGLTTGPHLHFEVRIDGVSVNPEKYLPKR